MTLNLTNSQAYFGFEWLAGDRNNVITFYNGSASVGSLNLGGLIAAIAKRAEHASYYGNPNNTTQDSS